MNTNYELNLDHVIFDLNSNRKVKQRILDTDGTAIKTIRDAIIVTAATITAIWLGKDITDLLQGQDVNTGLFIFEAGISAYGLYRLPSLVYDTFTGIYSRNKINTIQDKFNSQEHQNSVNHYMHQKLNTRIYTRMEAVKEYADAADKLLHN